MLWQEVLPVLSLCLQPSQHVGHEQPARRPQIFRKEIDQQQFSGLCSDDMSHTHIYLRRPIHQASYGPLPMEDVKLLERQVDLGQHNEVSGVAMSDEFEKMHNWDNSRCIRK